MAGSTSGTGLKVMSPMEICWKRGAPALFWKVNVKLPIAFMAPKLIVALPRFEFGPPFADGEVPSRTWPSPVPLRVMLGPREVTVPAIGLPVVTPINVVDLVIVGLLVDVEKRERNIPDALQVVRGKSYRNRQAIVGVKVCCDVERRVDW
jgi:hypothetical protein